MVELTILFVLFYCRWMNELCACDFLGATLLFMKVLDKGEPELIFFILNDISFPPPALNFWLSIGVKDSPTTRWCIGDGDLTETKMPFN